MPRPLRVDTLNYLRLLESPRRTKKQKKTSVTLFGLKALSFKLPWNLKSSKKKQKERLLSSAFLLPAVFADALEGSPGAGDLLAGEVAAVGFFCG